MDAKDIVREVQFNPTSKNDIVAGYESGNIQVGSIASLHVVTEALTTQLNHQDRRFIIYRLFALQHDY